MQKVWPDSFVEENNLAQNVSRKALGESLIQTIPKRCGRGDWRVRRE